MIDNPLNRLAVKRGSQLPHAKLDEATVAEVLATIEERDRLRARLKGMTNKAIAKRLGVHYRTIDRISSFESWTHVR